MLPHSFPRLTAFFLLVFAAALLSGQTTDPHITSWVTARSYARVYETTTDKNNGNAVSTWPRSGLTNGGGGQATAVYSDVQRVVYSTNYVYVYVTGLPSYTMGNWLTPNGTVYTSWPTNRATIHKIPRTPSIPTTKQLSHGSGGVLVNGVFVWENGDAQSYANASSTSSTASISMSGDGIWNRLAGVAETFNFDTANAHQPSNGAYHNHINPIALRYQLGDNVTYNAATKVYSEAATPTKHSPLIGWANDGLPIYGPYGYSSAMDSSSGIRRMTSGFVKRNSTNAALYGTDDLAVTGRVKLPVWAASVQGKSQTLTSGQYGPTTTATYNLGPVSKTCVVGTFAEDYEYLGDLGKTQGVDFDLNRQNVRYCVTPEFPNGTYAYFVCIDDNGGTVFPDIINQEYFGTAAMGEGTVSSISESVTEYERGGQASPITVTAEASVTGVLLSWTSVEGGTYTVASSQDGTTYTTISSSVASAGGTSTTYDTATLAPYYKVTLNAVATYDTNGNGGVSGVGTSGTVNYPAGATAPSITTQPAGRTVTTDTDVTFTVVATGTPTLTYQWFKGGNAISGATAASYTITKAQTADAGTYTVVVTNDAGNATSDDAVLVVNAVAPSITTQPSGQTVTTGTKVTFTVVATGTATLTYQWRKNGDVIDGATSASYVITSAQTTDAGAYSVVVTNGIGNATSDDATLVVNVPVVAPVITTPPATQTVAYGDPVTLSVTATSSVTMTYQWKKSGTAISGQTASTYSIASAAFADAGNYTVVVTNSAGSTTSSTATLSVAVPAPSLDVSGNHYVGDSFTATMTGDENISGISYHATGLPTGLSLNTVTGQISGTITASPGTYTISYWAQYGVLISTVKSADMVVKAVAPSITTQPAGQTVKTGADVTFTVVATGTATLTYQWRKGGTAITGATGASYTLSKAKTTDAGAYSVVVTNAAGSATSDDATLVVNDPPVITTQPESQTVLYDHDVTFSVVATSEEAVTYLWKKDNVAISAETGDSMTIPAIEFSDAGSYTVTVTNSVSGGSTTSSAAVLTVAVPAPSIDIAGEIPAGGKVSIDMTGDTPVGDVQYYATGLPSGLSLDADTGQITGSLSAAVGTYTVTYWAQRGSTKSEVQTVQIVVSVFPSTMVGSFEGLLEDGDGLPAGKVELKVTSKGAFTGKLTTTDTKSYSLKGTLALNDDYTAGSSTLSVSRGKGVDPYTLDVSVSSDSVLSASLDGVGDTDSGVQLASYGKGETSPWTAAYTLVLGDPVNLGAGTAPESDGYATATISSAGSLSVKGSLADGTKLSGSLSVSADGSYRWYLKPYKTAGGYLGGWLTLTERSDESGRYEASSSDFYWLKPASPKDKLYPGGFGPVGLTVEMQKWVAASSSATLADLLGASDGSVSLVIDGAGLSNDGDNTYTLPTLLTLNSKNAFVVGDATNPTKFSLKLSTSAGSFTGSCTLVDGKLKRKVTVQGVLLQEPSPTSATVVGRGYFLLPPTVKGDPTLSGALEMILP